MPGTRFCQSCGQSLVIQISQCSQCATPLSAGSRFCSQCGKAAAD
ncbi:MAG: double zinc ribbon domain-containing protein [Enterobacterales bacterium]